MNKETLEEETLAKIKFVLLAGNDAQAIRLLEQYGGFMQEISYSEEDIREAFTAGVDKESYRGLNFDDWFEQFKK